MPYTGSFRIPELPKAKALAERVGWEYAELAEEMLRTWSTSFKRLLVEKKSLLKGVNSDRRHVIEGVIASEYRPLDVQRRGALRERYFKGYAPSMYDIEKASMARALKKRFSKSG